MHILNKSKFLFKLMSVISELRDEVCKNVRNNKKCTVYFDGIEYF